jgi:glucokinase-like ROK family protein
VAAEGTRLTAVDEAGRTKPLAAAPERMAGLSAILDYVRAHGSTTRTELASATGLSRAVIVQRVGELVERGLLESGEIGPSTGGRAPRTVRFRSSAGHLLVADLGATSVDVAVIDLSSTVLAHASEPADVAAGPDVVLGRVEAMLEQLLADADELPGSLLGIGIGVPGPVEFESGRPVAPPIMPGWDQYDVRAHFASYAVPVWVDNDVNVMALAEIRAGVARGHENVVFIKIGTGIGAGIVVRGMLHRGAQGCAGDVGHIQVTDDESVVCRCGNVGCLEALAGGAALARDGETLARDGRSPHLAKVLEEVGAVEATDVAVAASHGDASAIELITNAGRLVGSTLAGIVNFFNPSLVVIGGGVAGSGDLLLATIRESVYRRSLPLATRDLLITRSSLRDLAGVTGAAAMVTDELFAPPRLVHRLAGSER